MDVELSLDWADSRRSGLGGLNGKGGHSVYDPMADLRLPRFTLH